MKLLVTAEDAPEDKTVNYSFRLGFNIATAPAISIPAATATSHHRRKHRRRMTFHFIGVDYEGG